MASIATGYKESTHTTGGVLARALARFTVPRMLIQLAAILLAVSLAFEYWSLTLHAPQYPDGLEVTIFTHEVVGDVSEVDGLNHYIGMMPLAEAAEFERQIAAPATILFILGAFAASLLRRKWTALLALGVVLFPIVFAVDLFFWLYRAGHDLDPTAALSSSIKPFTPAIVGEGVVGQFSTTAYFGAGFWIAVTAAVLAIVGIIGMVRGDRLQAPQ